MRKWAIGVGAVTAAIAAVAAWWLTSPGRAEVHVVWKAELEGADTAAPLTADLNGDNVQDVIVAAGIEEKFGRVTAYNGPDGEPLWSVDLRDEALLALPATDVNKDGAAEIFIGTRKDERDFRAVDGRNGTTLWRLTEANPDRKFPPVNFICGVELNDVNADGLNDVLVVQSGGRDDLRVPGQFYVVNSANGEVLQSHVTPDQRECYAAPVFQVQQEEQFLYLGTGGETLKGHVVKLRFPEFEEVWRVSTDDVLARTDDAAVYPKPAGFVATPLLVDLDGDGDLEIVAALLDGPLVCLDAGTGEIRWTTSLGGRVVSYSSPASGHFTGDDTLDIAIGVSRGKFPSYEQDELAFLDGSDGSLTKTVAFGSHQFKASSPLVLDVDNDGVDEVALGVNNRVTPFEEGATLRLVICRTNGKLLLDESIRGFSMSTPTIIDLDGDAAPDLFCIAGGQVFRLRLDLHRDTFPRVRHGKYRVGRQ